MPHPTLLHRCSVCGKPRLPPGPSTRLPSEDITRNLRAAGQSHRVSLVLQGLGYALLALGLPGLLLTAVVLLILMPGAWVTGIALGFALIPLLLWLFLRSRNKQAAVERDQALERAYSLAVLDTLRCGAVERDAQAIAQLVGLPLERTETLLTRLNADSRMTSRVTDDGELVFGVAEPARLRVQDASDAPAPAIIDAELDESAATESHTRHRT